MRLSSGLLAATSVALAAGDSVWDYAPYFANDDIQPYPSLEDAEGHNITVENVRGTHLFGWKGCSGERSKLIKKAYDDFYTLSNQDAVYKNIDWNGQAATDFWGPAEGPNKIPDDTRKEIAQIFKAAQQVYSYSWTWQPPWLSWRQLWIEIRCSDGKKGKGAPDPEDKCGDAEEDPGQCPSGDDPVGGGKPTLQAFSDPSPDDGRYSRITFCTDFFKLQEFSIAVDNAKKLPAAQKRDLSRWDNQARCMFHEITHLDYFMNAGPGDDDKALSPYVSDLEIEYTDRGTTEWHDVYGPYNARVLRNWVDADPQYSGYFTQRNADNYAWFAMAKYVEDQIKQYPNSPSPGRKKPKQEPRDAQTHVAPQSSGSSVDADTIDGDEQDSPADGPGSNGEYPGCGDKFGKLVPAASESASISSQHATPTPAPEPNPNPNPIPDPDCATDGLAFPQPPVEDFIQTFCDDRRFWDTVLTPPVSTGTGTTADGRGKAIGVSDSYDLADTSDKLWLAMMFTRDACTGTAQFTWGQNDEERLAHCTARFRTVLNGCQTDTITDKLGGMLKDVCIEYHIERQPDGTKPFDNWFGDSGEFTCEETDVSAVGGDSPLQGTCTCWFSNYKDTTDVFKMPPSGDCKDTSRNDLLIN